MRNRTLITFAFSFLFYFSSVSQIEKIDKIEMYYAQGHYKTVLRKSNSLLDKPDYDFSNLPSYYKSLSLLKLSQNEFWLKKHPNALAEAKGLLLKVKKSGDWTKIFNAHNNELVFLKNDLLVWAGELKTNGQIKRSEEVQDIISTLLKDVQSIDKENRIPVNDIKKETSHASKNRVEVVEFAKKQIGVPYVWSGMDKNGFDCSGFTSFVMKNAGIDLPRRAMDQEIASVKVKEKNVQPGDLVFFDNGSGVSHVGIIISEKGEPLQMIHASSSKGVIITKLSDSEYWKTRIFSFGSFLD